jgi:hypothetical protein
MRRLESSFTGASLTICSAKLTTNAKTLTNHSPLKTAVTGYANTSYIERLACTAPQKYRKKTGTWEHDCLSLDPT